MARAPMPAPQLLESPAVRRSAMLARLLEEQRQPTQITGGYGELAARLLGQGITQFSANRADRAVKDERAARVEGQVGANELMLADVLRESGRGAPPPAASAPPPPPTVPPVLNTQQPVEAMTAPAPMAAGSALPPAAPAGVPAPMPPMADVPPAPQAAPQAPPPPPEVAPQSQQNPLGMTPGEEARIREGIELARQTGDPAIAAWVRGEIDVVRQRMSAPAAERNEIIDRNGVSYFVDRAGVDAPRQVFGGSGVPDAAQNETFLASDGNNYGVPAGTLMTRTPNGVISVVNRPPEGMRREGGRLSNEEGFVEAGAERQRSQQGIELEGRREQERPQFEARIGRIEDTTRTIQEEVAYAQQLIEANPNVVGLIGTAAAMVPGSPAYDLAETLKAIGANVGFEYLQDMRNSNPTGGGVGALSDSEREALSSTAGSLRQGQSAGRLNLSLSRISRLTESGASRARSMYDSTYNRPAPRETAPSRPRPDAPSRAPSGGQRLRYNAETGEIE